MSLNAYVNPEWDSMHRLCVAFARLAHLIRYIRTTPGMGHMEVTRG